MMQILMLLLLVLWRLNSKYRNAGQTCVCTNRIFVQSGVLAEFTKKFVASVKVLQVGNGVDEGITIGP